MIKIRATLMEEKDNIDYFIVEQATGSKHCYRVEVEGGRYTAKLATKILQKMVQSALPSKDSALKVPSKLEVEVNE